MDPIVAEARAWIRGHLAGQIIFDGDVRPLRIVVAPDGRLVASVMVAMLRATEVVLALPDEGEESMQLMVTMEELDEHGPDGIHADRWRIHHGEPPDVRWGVMTIDAGRFKGWFLDGEGLDLRNPLAEGEGAACAAINRDLAPQVQSAAIAEARRRGRPPADWGLESPRVVGIDPEGIDVRGSYGILRIAVAPPLRSPADAAAALRRLAGS